MRGEPDRRRAAAALVAPLALLLVGYAPILRAGLTGEDLSLLRGAGDASLADFARPGGGVAGNPYWRPVWHAVNRLVLAAAGGDPLRAAGVAHGVSLGLFAVSALLVAAIARRVARDGRAPVLAACLFVASPGPVAAVAWFAAANKLLTLAFGLGAVLAGLRHGERGGRGALVASLLLGFLALGSSELAYPFALVLPAAAFLVAPGRAAGFRRGAALFVPLAVAVAAQALLLQPGGALRRGLPPGGVATMALGLLRHEAGFVSALAGGPVRPSDLLSAAIGVALAAAALAGRAPRYAVAWLLLAPLPTALGGVAAFHSVVAAAPFALLLSMLVVRAGRAAGARGVWIAAAGSLLLVVAWMRPVRAEVRGWVEHSREVLAFAREVRRVVPDLAGSDGLRLVGVPISFDAALLAFSERLPSIQRIDVLRGPEACFLAADFAWPAVDAGRVFEFVRGADGTTRSGSIVESCERRARVGGARVFYDAVPVADAGDALRRVATGRVHPIRTLCVEGAASLPSGAAPSDPAEVVAREFLADRVIVRLRVNAGAPGIVAVFDPSLAFEPDPRQVLLDRDAFVPLPRGFAQVDGVVAPLLTVHGLYRGAAVPAGEHDVVLVYTL